ncbi:hypothetical protein HDE_13937 [Halotydeus destructor]|nr:hypothetical protein HDE_13937 [Halotydeus destructor]
MIVFLFAFVCPAKLNESSEPETVTLSAIGNGSDPHPDLDAAESLTGLIALKKIKRLRQSSSNVRQMQPLIQQPILQQPLIQPVIQQPIMQPVTQQLIQPVSQPFINPQVSFVQPTQQTANVEQDSGSQSPGVVNLIMIPPQQSPTKKSKKVRMRNKMRKRIRTWLADDQ